MLLYSCACLNCTYRTSTDMPIGIAERAAEMHIMLPGIHKVKIINEQGIQVESYTNEKPQ